MKDKNTQKHELIIFNQKLSNRVEKVRAYSLANGYLAVTDRIYNALSGEPLIRAKFESVDLALEYAEWIESTLWDFFEIWNVYPEADIISWCKYSVKNGALLFEMTEYLKKLKFITENDIKQAYIEAEKRGKRWKARNFQMIS